MRNFTLWSSEKNRLGIVTSQFPEMHETFIVRELNALSRAGIDIRIYSLKYCRDRIVHPESQPLIEKTTYVAWNSPLVWGQALLEIFSHPVKAFYTFSWTVRYHYRFLKQLFKAIGIWFLSMGLTRLMRADQIGHVHAHWATMPSTAAVIVGKNLGVPFSFSAHAWDIFVPNGSLKEKVRLATKVITCTEYNRNYLSNLSPEAGDKIILNYHGVDLSKFNNEDEFDSNHNGKSEVPLFLSVGRLVETKGYATLIEAYRELRDQGEKFRAVIVGEGPLYREILSSIKRARLEGVVTLRQALPQIELRKLYKDALAFVLASVIAGNGDRDGIPNVILEAMAMGLPVVSTNISGIPEAVQNYKTGLNVRSHNVEELAQALSSLLQNRDRAFELGKQGRRLAERCFDEHVHMQSLVFLFRDMRKKSTGEQIMALPAERFDNSVQGGLLGGKS